MECALGECSGSYVVSIKVSGSALSKVDRNSAAYVQLREVHHRIARKDAATWGEAAAAEAAIRLNWVDLPETSPLLRDEINAVVAKFAHATRVVLCGMGGSSLAPEVLGKTFNREIVVVDSTDPHYLQPILAGDLAKSVFVVSSKSGSMDRACGARRRGDRGRLRVQRPGYVQRRRFQRLQSSYRSTLQGVTRMR